MVVSLSVDFCCCCCCCSSCCYYFSYSSSWLWPFCGLVDAKKNHHRLLTCLRFFFFIHIFLYVHFYASDLFLPQCKSPFHAHIHIRMPIKCYACICRNIYDIVNILVYIHKSLSIRICIAYKIVRVFDRNATRLK